MATYTTKSGDVLDQVCFIYYGTEGATELVLENNAGLAAYGVELPAGLEITLPDIEEPSAVTEQVQLWS